MLNTASILWLSAQSRTADNQVHVHFIYSLDHTHSIRWQMACYGFSTVCIPHNPSIKISYLVSWSVLLGTVSVPWIRYSEHVNLEQLFLGVKSSVFSITII